VFQALTLHDDLLSIGQPVLATELVFMLVPRRFWIRQSIPGHLGRRHRDLRGLTVFVIARQPGGDHSTPNMAAETARHRHLPARRMLVRPACGVLAWTGDRSPFR
jgi:hypothetical protein